MVKNQLFINLLELDMMFFWETIEETNIQGIIEHLIHNAMENNSSILVLVTLENMMSLLKLMLFYINQEQVL